MRTTHFSPILFNSLQLAGQDRHNISSETFAQFRDIISERIRMIWESQDWPDLVRFVDISSTITNVDGLVQAGIPSDAGEVLTCFNKNPLATSRTTELSFRLTNDGTTQKLTFLSDPGTVWAEYRIKRPELNGDVFDTGTAYSIGAQAYFDSGSNTGTAIPIAGKPHYGNFYTCLEATTAGQSPHTHPAKWELISLPYLFAGYVARGAFADWLRSEMQLEAAQAAEADAERVLNETLDIVLRQQGQVNRINMNRTY